MENQNRQTLHEKIKAALIQLAFGFKQYEDSNLKNYEYKDDDEDEPEENYEEIHLVENNDETPLFTLDDSYKADLLLKTSGPIDQKQAIWLFEKAGKIWDQYISNKMYPKYDPDKELKDIELVELKWIKKNKMPFTMEDVKNIISILKQIDVEKSLEDGIDKNGQRILI